MSAPDTPEGREPAEAVLALARALLPDGRLLRGASDETVVAARKLVEEFAPRAGVGIRVLAETLDRAAILRTGRRFSLLPPDAQEGLVRTWERHPVLRFPLNALSYLFRLVHFDDPDTYRALRTEYEKGGPPESTRWWQQVVPGETWTDGEEVECDAVVVGTGAGGAVVGRELAARGHAVLFLEEGDYHRRDAFDGRALDAHRRFYRYGGALPVLGNSFMPVLMGRLVGGSTAINTATCFRTPSWILDRWCERLGTDDFSPSRFERHFDSVERFLQVEPANEKYLGGAVRVVRRGCEALGWHHFRIRRNAPGCDAQGVCDFGCPSDGRTSTNISYVPSALGHGALLVTGMRAERVLVENGRAVGMEARSTRGGARLVARARVVVLACGAVPTPLLLLGQGIANSSGQVGRNLTLHPSTELSALFEETVEGYNAIPQGCGCDEFHREGILLVGASPAPNIASLLLPMSGRRLMDAMESLDRIASFGVLVEDEARGRVRRGHGGLPLVTYSLGAREVERLRRGITRIAEIFVAAGAKRVLPALPRLPEIDASDALKRLRSERLRPRDFLLMSYHPMGTCRMGRDRRGSVVDLEHEAHDVRSLFVVDGSTVPTATAVNPQITIMAMAHRAAERIAARLD